MAPSRGTVLWRRLRKSDVAIDRKKCVGQSSSGEEVEKLREMGSE